MQKAAEAMKTRGEEMEEIMEAMPEEEMVELTKKRSGLTLPTPNVEDAGMLMGMGKRSHHNIEIFMFRLHTGRLELRSSYWMVD